MFCVLFVLFLSFVFLEALVCFDPREVQVLKFDKNGYTKYNETKSVKQMRCISDSYGDCYFYSESVDNIVCKNLGVDDNQQIIWDCSGKKSEDVDFNGMQITCEGCHYPDDNLKIVGSCSVEYHLKSSIDPVFMSILGLLVFFGLGVPILIAIIKMIYPHNRGYHNLNRSPQIYPSAPPQNPSEYPDVENGYQNSIPFNHEDNSNYITTSGNTLFYASILSSSLGSKFGNSFATIN